jgi:hypothetical protein
MSAQQEAAILRPHPDMLAQFMPLWNARNEAIERGDKLEEQRLTIQMRQFQIEVGMMAHGEYVAEHLRPIPEFMAQFVPLWDERNYACIDGDLEKESALTSRMRPFQNLLAREEFPNIVTTVGKNDFLDKYLLGSSYTQTIRMGLKGTGTAVAGDTQASHAGWLEQGLANAPTYTGNRKSVTMGSASAGVSTSPTQAFAITSTGTVFGCFINNGGSATIDNTTGVLFSAGYFSGGSRAVVNLDTLNVVYTLTAT